MTSVVADYGKFLLGRINTSRPVKAVFDGSNGSTGPVLVYLKRKSKELRLELLDVKPDGDFAAHGPNPLRRGAERDLSQAVRESQADFGAVFDADGDRVFFVDDRGRKVPADAATLLLILYLKPSAAVIDARAGYLLQEMCPRGTKLITSRAGSYFIKKLMRARKIPFGAEPTGHYYFRSYADSGILAALFFASAISRVTGRMRLSAWLDLLPATFRSPELNFRVKDKKAAMRKVEGHFKKSAKAVSRRDGLKMEFKNWWFILRPSNTEDLLRLNIEARDRKMLRRALTSLRRLLNV